MEVCVAIGDAFKELECIGEVDRNKLVKVQFILNIQDWWVKKVHVYDVDWLSTTAIGNTSSQLLINRYETLQLNKIS